MLEHLDTIDWSRLSHAYGEATNVPTMLWALASHDRDERENAFDGLFWSIHHQGTIYDSTAPAVPFLLELVASPEVLDRDHLLDLLAAIAGGVGYRQVHQVYDAPAVRASPEYQEGLAEERACQRAVRKAVWRAWPVFLALLRDDEAALRQRTLKVLQRLLEQPRPELPAALRDLIACLQEPAHPEKAGILLRLGEAARFHADPREALRAAEDHHEHAISLSNMTDLDPDRTEDGLPAWLELTEEDRQCGRAALVALDVGWPVFEQLSRAEDTAVREAAVFLQAMLLRFGEHDPAALVTRWLERLETAADEREQVNLVFAISASAQQDPRVPEALRRLLQRGQLAGYIAALKLVDLTGDVDDRGLDLLLDVQRDSSAIYDQLQAMPRWEPYWVLPRLERLGPAVVERRLEAFVEIVRSTGKGLGSSGQARALLRAAFGGKKLPAGATVLDLTEAQRQILLAAADNGHFWSNTMNDRLELDRLLGLPNERAELRRFLARPEEPVSGPRNDPEEALVQFERLVGFQLPFEFGVTPYQREEGDTRAPFRQIQEGVEEVERISKAYRPKDRTRIHRLAPQGHTCDALVALLPLCPNLEELDLGNGEATDASMHHLARLFHLKTLNLTGNHITDAALAHLAGLTELCDLGLCLTEVTDAGLRHLAGLAHLRQLNLSQTRVQGAGLAHLGATGLEEIWLITDHLTDAAVAPVAALHGLRELHLNGKHFTGRGLESWHHLTGLQQLTLGGRLAAETLAALPIFEALERLTLRGEVMGDAHIQALPVFPALKSLSLWKTGITDAALAGIERLPVLGWLDLSWTRVTDAALVHLRRVESLRGLSLWGTTVTDGAIEELRRALPEVHVSK